LLENVSADFEGFQAAAHKISSTLRCLLGTKFGFKNENFKPFSTQGGLGRFAP
jgi:hypothetical protein